MYSFPYLQTFIMHASQDNGLLFLVPADMRGNGGL